MKAVGKRSVAPAAADAPLYPYHNGGALCRRRWLSRLVALALALGLVAPAVAGLRVEINLPAYSLRLFDGDELVMERPVTIGAPEHPTPVGRWRVNKLIWNPRWMPPPSMDSGRAEPMPPGPGNPMGAVKLPLYKAVYLHGTERHDQLGRPASHGCVRLANADARALARHLQRRLLDPAARQRVRRRLRTRPDTPVAVALPEPVPVRVSYRPLVMEGRRGVMHPDVYGRLDDVRGYLRRALARNLEVPVSSLSLGEGGLLARLDDDWQRPLRFDLEFE
jgi:murein L,D-transpeptidase YcbB/YkuD